MTGWRQLETALDAAARRGETIRFWWRDDDSGREAPALMRLIEMAERRDLPLALAVVPDWLQPDAQASIAASAGITVLQHGFAHTNHAKKGRKSIELGSRESDVVLAELRRGFTVLEDAFGAAFLPVLVPPWNRIDEALHPHLREGGYGGLSVFGKRIDRKIAKDVALVNTHLDPIDWRGTRGFIGEEILLERLTGDLDPEEPIGILSHHLVMDEATWSFLDKLFETLTRHPAGRFCSAPYLFSHSNLASGNAA